MTATKSSIVDAPIINEFPICMECEFIEYQDDEYGCGVIGKVVKVTADENVMKGDNVDIALVDAIAFDPYTHGYYKIGERVGNMSLEEALKRYRERDMRMKSTTVGPHRDDICFTTDSGLDVRKFGSQGQQRTAALSLKMSEIELVKQVIKDTPVLLLDDVLSELDKHRQNYLLDSINNIQTIITCTGLDEFVNHRFSINKIFHIRNGHAVNAN